MRSTTPYLLEINKKSNLLGRRKALRSRFGFDLIWIRLDLYCTGLEETRRLLVAASKAEKGNGMENGGKTDRKRERERERSRTDLLRDAERGGGHVGDVPVEEGEGVGGVRGGDEEGEGDGEERRQGRHCSRAGSRVFLFLPAMAIRSARLEMETPGWLGGWMDGESLAAADGLLSGERVSIRDE